MALRSMHNGLLGGFFKFIIFGLLGLAVLGMAVMDVGGFFRNGVSSMDVAKIEGKRVTIQNFDRILRRTLSQYNMTPQDAFQDGTLQAVLANEIRANFVDIEAENAGLSLNKDYLQKRIAEMVAPNVQEGQTMQQTLDTILRMQQIDETTFVKGIDREISADILTESVKSAFPSAQYNLAKDLFLFQNQTRDIELLSFADDSITDTTPATDKQLTDLYEQQKDTTFSTPELRHIKIGLLDSDSIASKVEITDEELKEFYDENIESFVIQKQTILSQVIIPDKDKAQQIIDLVNKGTDFKTATGEIIKEEVNFFEKVPFDMSMMIPEITKALDGKEIGAIVGPIETQLGNHIVQLDGYTEEKTQDFETVKDSIRAELLGTKSMDTLFKVSQTYDDLIAGGATFEEIAKEVSLKILDIPATSRYGLNGNEEDAFATLPENIQQDKIMLIEAAYETGSGEISRIIELPSGNFAAVKIESVQEKTPKPFDSVKQKIADDFISDQKTAANQKRVANFVEDLNQKKISTKALAEQEKIEIKTHSNLTIAGGLEKPLKDEFRPTLFKTPIGGFDILRLDNAYAILHIKGYSLPEINDTHKEQISNISDGLNQEIKGEAFAMYLDFLAKKYVAIINEPLLNQAYAPKQTEGQ